MLATQDVCDLEVPEEVLRTRAERLIEMGRGISLMQLMFAKEAAEFAATEEYEEWGATTPIDWIRIHCHMTGPQAANYVAAGEHFDELPQTTLAMAEGKVGFGHMVVMARTTDALAISPTAKVFDEQRLLAKALDNTVGKFHHICRHLRHAADPKGYAATEVDLVENRSLRISTDEDSGAVFLSGVFDSVGGAAVRTALEPLARRTGADDLRPYDRRMADALIDMSMHALDNGLVPQNASQRTHLQVTTSLETLLGLDGAPAAELEFSLPISAKAVERLACDCSVTRILLGSDSMVIDVGRAKRVISGAQRKALNARDQHCAWPGCDRPASWTSGHHLKHWIHGGTSDLPNLALLCYRHHWMVHEGGWQIVRGDGGRIVTIPPTVTFGPSPRGPD
ncbi:MAG TPA: DUF222 domain-containing protein [Candidatus Dormibacteraeota bacterium]|jgi:hypothetical protein